ncbi:carotenoid biosynthesis protein [Ferruginibacter paludis]|uniref:carotenoid biosynthesis protein n=1 Tax=Ferruginibacter paludis TaxID=1310417 RepID=UPI0025B5E51B|nr:carotenoid biosynthesis protein [Ferruginibacter paludis]MDN3658359.1 carotenoid biosynthesis protein [Ferruginibacter paludis]
MLNNISKYQAATFIAILFHTIGLVGILVFNSTFIIQSTPFNLLLSATLLIWTHKDKNKFFYLFAVIAFIAGFAAEVIGVNTGLLFGNYSYGDVLGFKWQQVPVVIGINWLIVVYCCGITIHTFLNNIISKLATETKAPPIALKGISVIADGATLAVLFDWLIEPVAVKLGYWQWKNGSIPLYNYMCWLAIGALLLAVFHFCRFNKQNKFAIHLLLIQVMFFLLLRTFLK